tara:strand:+ start:97015 stop:98487 length:1473 start_codon:yes stop_codon:yes gene_type:complete
MTPIPFDNSYAKLPEAFFSRLAPTPVAAPRMIRTNNSLAEELGIDPQWLASSQAAEVVAGNLVPPGADPIATVYAGHQFGSYNPQLGDGRAILLGEVVREDGQRFDVQLKGAGRTPYSRGGDGRSPLGPVVREYLISEAMHALGVPTTRALAAACTGETVVREDMLPGAVLARVASSHIRIGTFQFFAARGDTEALQTLLQHAAARHYPGTLEQDNCALAFLQTVISRQAQLVARWQLLGFIHGVMNTDNMLVSGETVDYGPCAFMDAFNPEQVFSSIDHAGRYAYRNQPGIAHWNLACLAQALIPLLHEDKDQAVAMAQTVVDTFPGQFLDAHTKGMARKLGLEDINDDDTALVEDLFQLMADERVDFTLMFRHLSDVANNNQTETAVAGVFDMPEPLAPWLQSWRERAARGAGKQAALAARMYRANPAFIPRNHRVEEAILAANSGDFEPFNTLADLLQTPHDYQPEWSRYATPPEPSEVVHQTFCGT